MSKRNREKIKLVSTSGSKHFYTTTKNRKNITTKISIKKFDPKIRKHFLYTEKKIK